MGWISSKLESSFQNIVLYNNSGLIFFPPACSERRDPCQWRELVTSPWRYYNVNNTENIWSDLANIIQLHIILLVKYWMGRHDILPFSLIIICEKRLHSEAQAGWRVLPVFSSMLASRRPAVNVNLVGGLSSLPSHVQNMFLPMNGSDSAICSSQQWPNETWALGAVEQLSGPHQG